jgi:predicted nucleic acid-binding protein
MSRPAYVVDASVAAKWVLPEEDQSRALQLEERYQDEEIDLMAPSS